MLVIGNKFALGSFTLIEEKYVVASAFHLFCFFVPSLPRVRSSTNKRLNVSLFPLFLSHFALICFSEIFLVFRLLFVACVDARTRSPRCTLKILPPRARIHSLYGRVNARTAYVQLHVPHIVFSPCKMRGYVCSFVVSPLFPLCFSLSFSFLYVCVCSFHASVHCLSDCPLQYSRVSSV